MSRSSEFKETFFLTAGECDATSHMPVTLLTKRIIEVATGHANSLGIGYANLKEYGIGWVLTRLSIAMTRWPGINETYTLITWIESFNHRFSNRCFLITDADGNEIGHARSMWAAINFNTRSGADLSAFEGLDLPMGQRKCPITGFSRMPSLPDSSVLRTYTFKYCDIDFNRHVNTVRYMDLILNSWALEHYDANMLSSFEIAFHHECRFADTVELRVVDAADTSDCEIVITGDSPTRAVAAKIGWKQF